MEQDILEKQLYQIIVDKNMSEDIKLAKIDMLIKLGVDINALYAGSSALNIATCHNLKNIADFLKKNGAEDIFIREDYDLYGRQLLQVCSLKTSNFNRVKELVEDGVDVNYRRYRKDDTALILASHNGHKDIVEYLLEKGADVNIRGEDNQTALVCALSEKHYEIAKILIDNDANANLVTSIIIPLRVAIHADQKELVELMLQKGADVNLREWTGGSALLSAIEKKDVEIVKLLLKNGADVNALDYYRDTPLIRCLMAGGEKCTEIAEILIENGAYVNFRREYGTTPLMIAIANGHKKIANILIDKGAYINVRNKDGDSALGYACQNNDVEMVKRLLEKGADVSIGISSRYWAENDELKELLINAFKIKKEKEMAEKEKRKARSFLGKIKKGLGIGE